MNEKEETLPMSDGLTEIRRQLLWDRIREINTTMSEEMFQAMKAMPISEWTKTWIEAGLDATPEDLAAVHEMLWPNKVEELFVQYSEMYLDEKEN